MSIDDAPATAPGDEWRSLKRSDLALLRRAATRGWRVPDVVREEAIYQALAILATKPKPRDKLAAMRVLVAFDRADQADDRLGLAREALDLKRPAGSDVPTVRDVMAEMREAAARYEREHGGGDRRGAGDLPDGPGAVQRDDPGA